MRQALRQPAQTWRRGFHPQGCAARTPGWLSSTQIEAHVDLQSGTASPRRTDDPRACCNASNCVTASVLGYRASTMEARIIPKILAAGGQMNTPIFQVSDLANKRTEFIEAAREGRARLRDRDGTS